MPPKQQADDEIHENQLLNFLVNTLTGTFSLTLGGNAEISPEDIFEGLGRVRTHSNPRTLLNR